MMSLIIDETYFYESNVPLIWTFFFNKETTRTVEVLIKITFLDQIKPIESFLDWSFRVIKATNGE